MIKNFIEDTAGYAGVNIVTSLVTFLTIPIYTRYLSIDNYGLMALILSFSSILAGIFQCGIPNAMQRFFFDKKDENKYVIQTSIFLTMFLNIIPFLGFIILAFFIIDYMPEIIKNNQYLFFLAFLNIFFISILNLYVDIQRLHFNLKSYTCIKFFMVFSNATFSLFFLICLEKEITGIFEGTILSSIVSFLVASIFLKKHIGFKVKRTIALELLGFGYPFIFAAISITIFNNIDRWFLAYFFGNDEVGLYTIGYNLSNIVIFFNTAFSLTWAPYVFKLFAEDVKYKITISETFNLFFCLIYLVSILVSIYAKNLLQILTPSSYWEAGASTSILTIVALISFTHQYFALGISLEKQTKYISKGWTLTLFLNIILNFILIPFLGHFGAALATALSFLFLSFYYLYYAQKIHPFPIKIFSIFFLISTIFFINLLSIYVSSYNFSFFYDIVFKFPLVLIGFLSIFISRIVEFSYITNLFDSFLIHKSKVQ